jgi:hypothetical protein
MTVFVKRWFLTILKGAYKILKIWPKFLYLKMCKKILEIFQRKILKCARYFFKKYSPNILKMCVRNLEICLKYFQKLTKNFENVQIFKLCQTNFAKNFENIFTIL